MDFKMLYESGQSIPELSKLSGITKSTLRRHLIKIGTKLRKRADGIRLCIKQNKRKSIVGIKRTPFSIEHRKKIRNAKLKWSKKNAKGFSIKQSGYATSTIIGTKDIGIHRIIMENYLGRKLDPWEIVHHCDGNKLNNKIENLELMLNFEHARSHRLKEKPRERNVKGEFI